MEIIVLGDVREVARFGAGRISELVNIKPAAVLGLATGSTQIEIYAELVRLYRQDTVSFRETTTFNLDEYIGIDSDSPHSYRSFMRKNFFDVTDIDKRNTHLPECAAHSNPVEAGESYEDRIAGAGGIDLQVLGIGQNGHIGFNEPTSSLASHTRIKTLTANTVHANSRLFEAGEFQPNMAMTMGIATILRARNVLLVATGESKAEAVRNAVEGPVSSMCPASALQMHRRATFLLDDAAASLLSQPEYYKWVQEQNEGLLSRFGHFSDIG